MFNFFIAALNLSIVEIVVLQLGGIVLGMAIHFFIISRRNPKSASKEKQKIQRQLVDLKREFSMEAEMKDKELYDVKLQLKEADENSRIYNMELEEIRRQNKKLQIELENKDKSPEIEIRNKELNLVRHQLSAAQENIKNDTTELEEMRHQIKKLQAELENKPRQDHRTDDKPDYIEQLREAQNSLLKHNQKIDQLLGQIYIVQENEEKQLQILKDNEELHNQLNDLQYLLSEKESELSHIRQKEHLTIEMTSMLDNTYAEFNILQGKIQKLESQASASRMANLEYEDLKEANYRMSHEFEQLKSKLQGQILENQQITTQLNETEDKLKEATFQRQQLQKRVSYFEELNNDLQTMSEANRKLEGQIRSIGELESKLNLIAEERDQLLRQQMKS